MIEKFDAEARERVNAAVTEAERRTAAEILPVVARSSGRYDRAEDIVGVWTAILLLGVVWYLCQGVSDGEGWSGEPAISLGFWWVALVFVAGFIGGVVLANRVERIRRLFVPLREMQTEAVRRAKMVFFDRRLHRTSRASGVLIYVSILERQVVVLADDTAAGELGEQGLETVRDEVLAGVRGGDLSDGLVRGIDRVGALLAERLPAADDDRDEVPGEVVMLE